jgi:hypothetical protein
LLAAVLTELPSGPPLSGALLAAHGRWQTVGLSYRGMARIPVIELVIDLDVRMSDPLDTVSHGRK